MCLKKLKISHYMSTPGLSCNAMLKTKKLSLNLFQTLTCTYSLRKIKRDRISCISNRCSKANNKYLQSYDLKQESKHIFTQIIYMVMQCLNFFQQVDSNR